MDKPRHLRLPLNCGDKTCASEPGKFCKFMLTRHFGQDFYCQIFGPVDMRGRPESLPQSGPYGWTLRWPECIAAEETDHA
jgi:hypothetical protein